MSRRFWWRAGSTPATATQTPPAAEAWWAILPSAPAISTLLDLAHRRESGVLELTTEPGGAVYLAHGLVSQVVSPGVPGVAQRVVRRIEPAPGPAVEARPAQVAHLGPGEHHGTQARAESALRAHRLPQADLHALLIDAAADAALDLFAGRDAGPPATRFTPDRPHWAPLPHPLPVSALLEEIARRRRVLAAVAGRSQPDAPALRAVRLPVRQVRLTARQWDLVRTADGRRAPRTMAHELGAGVFATTVDVAALVQAGLLVPVTREVVHQVRTPAAAMPFLHAVSGS